MLKIQMDNFNKSYEITKKLLVLLGWEMDRMSPSGKETLEELWKIWDIPTDGELKEKGLIE